uniref:Uncharacterized protein AlNc14C116G6534 n=1 Tax=Albugo laibachii Nc14 TaxID=890382 RepID=F0W089_9STRA|nr:conserved hypothetical protein [Albugo laibachii Nc14]CCA21244.1 conserved hypothetical protein [Albugo laibachii Nc14]|eukprot:CCA21244.1 conserved hypothetical protein [Albugo laibachii Nc14]
MRGKGLWRIGFLRWSKGIDYPGGWAPGKAHNQCFDICKIKDDRPVLKHRVEGEEDATYDYLLLEQLYIPQYCRDLLEGVDYTVSHRPVLPYPDGIRCNGDVAVNELRMHGLWPNNYDGSYPSCCKLSKKLQNHPIQPISFYGRNYALLRRMQTQWVDPTQSTSFEALCELYNHEFQKHGSCFVAGSERDEDINELSALYFDYALQAASHVGNSSNYIKMLAAASPNASISLRDLHAIYPKRIQVFCSNTHPEYTRLAAIRTCYARPEALSVDESDIQLIDCPVAQFGGSYSSCDPIKPVSLLGYRPIRSNPTEFS